MSAQRILQNVSTLRVLAVGGSISWGYYNSVLDQEPEREHQHPLKNHESNTRSSFEGNSTPIFGLLSKYEYLLSLVEPTKTLLDANIDEVDNNTPRPVVESPADIIVYDFVVIGNGNAGQSAIRTLRERCPKAKIAVIDPLRPASSGNRVDHFRETVTGFNPNLRTVQLLSDTKTQLQFIYGILVATGARGAPPPLELFEVSSLSRVLELRTTELLGNTKRPIMAPERARKAILEATSRGGKIAVLGSGWEALDLVCAAEKVDRKKPTIVFGNPGPAWNILPHYLSSELRKKLVKRDIDIHDRSIVRYVADIPYATTRKLELHTAKTYDLLETRRTILDLLVVAPDSFGAKGTAALPTTEIPERVKESSDGRPWYKTWSQLTKTSPLEPSVVVCFEDDGRVAVNAELCAASRIYAAGSVAKYPNSSTGQASIAGEGSLNGAEAGRVAAMNMSQDYIERSHSPGSKPHYAGGIQSFAASSLPVWRSDITSYPSQGSPVSSSLGSLGVEAICVGSCDSERLATRAFWWTNSSAQRKIARMLEDEAERPDFVETRRMTRRRQSKQRRKVGLVTPIFGIGVVYYLDSNGIIRGIMTWGLPFTDEEGGPINPQLLSELKRAIVTNAGVPSLDAEENHQLMNTALAKQSQRLVSLAVRGNASDATTRSHGLDGPIAGFSTPLYRYTEIGHSKNSTVNVLKRKEGGGLGVLGEDLYARDELAIEQGELENPDMEEAPSNNIPATMYPVTVVPFHVEEVYGAKAASLDSLVELNRYLAVQRSWEGNENRARPGKEDKIWLRPGDERRNVSKKQMLIDAYQSIMFQHRS